MDRILHLLMSEEKFKSKIQNSLGKFLIENKDIFSPNLLYTPYINLNDFLNLYESSNLPEKDKNLMLTRVLNSKFVSDNEKDFLLSNLKNYNLDEESIENIFSWENLSINLKRKYFKEYMKDKFLYKYIWNEDIPIEWIKNDFPDLNEKETFFKLFHNRNIPEELIKLEYLEEILKINDKPKEDLSKEEKELLNVYSFDSHIMEFFYGLEITEVKKFLKKDFFEQGMLINGDEQTLLKLYRYYSKFKISKNEICDSLPLEYKLVLFNFKKEELHKIIKNEIKNYKIDYPNDDFLKFSKSPVLTSIVVKQNFIKELLTDYSDKIDIKGLISYSKNKIKFSPKQKKEIIENFDKKRNIIESFFHENSNLTYEEEKYYFKNEYINENNMYFYSNYMHCKDEKQLEKYISGENSKYLFENQKFSEEFMIRNIDSYKEDDTKSFYVVLENQEFLPEKYIEVLKEKGRYINLLENTNYMFNKEGDIFKEELINTLKEKISGGNKFRAIMGYIINPVLKEENMRIEMKNSFPHLISNEEYINKYIEIKNVVKILEINERKSKSKKIMKLKKNDLINNSNFLKNEIEFGY